ncbi:hypothetical protein O6V14_17810 [Sphingomonas faeni]|uniref:hypothetical protein n=1 Tax=Sphingomonas faeni TaxID=185950 RepID=UPI00335D38AC
MIVDQRQADASLRGIVRSFAERQAQLGVDAVTSPLPARPDQFIEFICRIAIAFRTMIAQHHSRPKS